MPERDYAAEFAEARSIIRRVVEDWPYQPPEVIEPEMDAFRAWLKAHPFDMGAAFSALDAQAVKPSGGLPVEGSDDGN